jgi:hypothetical protein
MHDSYTEIDQLLGEFEVFNLVMDVSAYFVKFRRVIGSPSHPPEKPALLRAESGVCFNHHFVTTARDRLEALAYHKLKIIVVLSFGRISKITILSLSLPR